MTNSADQHGSRARRMKSAGLTLFTLCKALCSLTHSVVVVSLNYKSMSSPLSKPD